MSLKSTIFLAALAPAAVLAQGDAPEARQQAAAAPPNDFDYQAAAASISAELSNPTFVPYSRPNQKIEEWIALGDSYTAGTGSNGNVEGEIFAGDAVRGGHSYPMQMAVDKDNWAFLSGGDETLPRFSFHAYTGDKTDELVSEQLKEGEYKDDKTLPRAQPFGAPQLATVSIGGNDAKLSTILNDCIYRAWQPGDCQETLNGLQKDIGEGKLRDKINYGLYQVAHTGRKVGGANPRESFQVYVPSYIPFFNEVDTKCNDITWNYWSWFNSEPKLKTELRKQLNDLTKSVNGEIKKAAGDLASMGVIFVEGLDDAYKKHRYCEPETTHDDGVMVDYDTWFWSPYAHFNTKSQGPGDPENPYDAADTFGRDERDQALLDFIFPGKNYTVADGPSAHGNRPPWEWEGADKYPTFEDLMRGIQAAAADGEVDAQAVPFNYLRSFHPKGVAYAEHARHLFAAMVDNRDEPSVPDNNEDGPKECQGNQVAGDCVQGHYPADLADFSGPQPPICGKWPDDKTPRLNADKTEAAVREYCHNLVEKKFVLKEDGAAPAPGIVPDAAENGGSLALAVVYFKGSCPTDKTAELDFGKLGEEGCFNYFYEMGPGRFCSMDKTWSNYDPEHTIFGGVIGYDCGMFSVSGQ